MILPGTLLLFFLTIVGFPVISVQDKAQVIRDDLNAAFPLGPGPERIISLAPNITEILFALGLGEKIVGVTRYCDYPAQALEKEKIGGMIDLNLEKIRSLSPDLIIGFRGNPLRILQRLRNFRFPVYVLDTGQKVEDVFSTIYKIGRITHREEEAHALTLPLQKRYRQIERSLQNIACRPKVFLSLHGEGLWTCGQESFLSDLLNKGGGVNIAGSIRRKWLHLNREQLIHEDPEVMIIMARSEKEFSDVSTRFRNDPHFQKIRAIQENRLYFLDENTASRFGPRLIDALSRIAHLLHPQLIPEIP